MRRLLIGTVLAALTALTALPAAAQKQVQVRIGWNSFAGAAPILITMQQQKLFEQEAGKFGYDVTSEWINFTAGAPPANAAMVAGRLDIDVDNSSGPMVTRIRQKVPITIFGVHASHISNAIVVRPRSDIKEVADLAGKTVGLPLGTSAHYTLASIVKQTTGKSIQELGIKLVNMVPADGIKMPRGIDAAAVWVPFRFMGRSLGTAELLIDSSGFTGPAHKNPNRRADDVKHAWGYPEGYLLDRLYMCARNEFAAEHPDLLVAFLRARIQAQNLIMADPDTSLAAANTYWKLDPTIAAMARDTYPENSGVRDAPFVLENDALAIIKASEFFVSIETIDNPLSWSELKPVLTPRAQMQKKAWDENQMQPSFERMQVFKGSNPTWKELNIAGGQPIWTMDQTPGWGERLYKPGPFLVK
jgi:ABC-type nitrate/sulfonate/bicarbonate transport system substrate-binding protein